MMNLKKATDFVWENARLLDRAIYAYRFTNGPAERIIDILRSYQNADGGFGHALEPDLRTPESQPLYLEFALGTLYDCGLRDPRIASRACDFLARHADLERGIAPLFPTFSKYPHAGHWDNPACLQPSLDRLIGLVGLARWQCVRHPWLEKAIDACLEKVAALTYTDAHTVLPALCLLESVSAERNVEPLFQKLSAALFQCRFFCLETPVKGYGLTPLDIAPRPDAYARRIFTVAQIEAHLDDLESRQEDDGGWPVTWGPPGEAARWEWRGHGTVKNLCVLRAYGRI